MASVGDLAALSNWAYKPTERVLEGIGNGKWVERNSASQSAFGFSRIPCTTLSRTTLLLSFGEPIQQIPPTFSRTQSLASGIPRAANPIATFARQYADDQTKLYGTSTVTITGHSLGGWAAQVAMITLDENPNVATAFKNSLSAVVFNAPGVTASDPSVNPQNYNVYAFNTQGDVVSHAGGTELGKSVTLVVGQPVTRA